MFIERLSKYTLSELKELFQSHPYLDNLKEGDKRAIFENAANDVRSNFDLTEQIQNSGITNDRYTYTGTNDDITLVNLGDNDRDDLRLSLKLFNQLDSSLKENSYLKDLSETQRRLIYAIAQNEYNRLVNDSDAYDYPLWYPEGAAAGDPDELNKVLPFTSSFATGTVSVYEGEMSRSMEFSSSFSTGVGGIVSSPHRTMEFTSSFATAITEGFIGLTETSRSMEFSSSFATAIDNEVSQQLLTRSMSFSSSFATVTSGGETETRSMNFSSTFGTVTV